MENRIYIYPDDRNLIPNDGKWHDNARRTSKGIVSLWGDKFNTYTVSCGASSEFSYTGSFYPEIITIDEAKTRIDKLIYSSKFHKY